MDGHNNSTQDPNPKQYKSRPGALAWFFRKSRDGWKRKYRDLKVSVKGLKNRIADLTKSREQWRTKAEQAGQRLANVEAENAELRARIAAAEEKKNGPEAGPLNLTPTELDVPRGQQYAVGVVQWFLTLVLDCGASLRCAAAVLGMIGMLCGRDDLAPDRSSGRLWLLRLGLAALLRPKVIAADWAWMIDHSIQIGPCKCLVILGIRLGELPEGRALCHRDLEPIALVPMTSSTKQTVAACLEEATAQTGVPRVILDDHGADLHGGVEIFRAAHPGTVEVYDITHKAACLLKARLEGDERWKSYSTESGQAKFQMQQTELASLVPPSQRSKARFMNVGKLVEWGVKTLALLDAPARLVPLGITEERMREKLSWLEGYREALGEWSGYQEVIDGTLDFVRRRGLYAGAEIDLAAAVPARSGPAGELRAELMEFVRGEGLKARRGSGCRGRRRWWNRASGSSRRWRTVSRRGASRGWC